VVRRHGGIYMDSLSVVLGLAGAILILVGLIGGGFTFSGSVMPAVGKVARIPCLIVGGILVFFAIGLAGIESGIVEGDNPSPAVVPAQATDVPTSAPLILTQPTSAPTQAPIPRPAAAGTLVLDSYVYQLPSLGAATVGNLSTGAQVKILCTAQGDVVVRYADGASSSLWDFVGIGFVPDIAIETGTNQAVAGPC
jgi:hypothetical protein